MNKQEMRILNQDGTLFNPNDVLAIGNYESCEIPILYINGSTQGMTKDNAVTMNYIYGERAGTCTVKWQGSSSIGFPKKNYTVKFDNAFEVVSGWGAQNKYCFKANWVDPSHARNLISAKLWGQIVKARTTANAKLNELPNGGAVDGFPVIIALNGQFHGLYTWNIPKDGWMFGMSGTSQQQAILCADGSGDAVGFKGLADFTNDYELEYSSDDESAWVLESINRLITAVMNSDGTNIEYGITPYIDWDSVIDYMIHTVLTHGYDGIYRNFILATYDGVKWFFSAYDMDTTYGAASLGKYFIAPTGHDFAYMASRNKLFELVWKYMRPQLRTRYKAIRESVMSEMNLALEFYNFSAKIPLTILLDDLRMWKRMPSTSASNVHQILEFYRLRIALADQWIENTSGQLAMPEQVNPNTPTLSSISATYTGGNVAVGTSLTSLTGITVTATYSDGSTSNVTGYSLSGTIAEGANTITVTYEGLTTTFTVTGVVEYTYTNQVPISIDTDGSIFNGVGYIGGTRLSSSGGTKSADYASVTGYIPASSGAVIEIPAEYFETSGSCYVCSYDSKFSFLSAVNSDGAYGGGTVATEGNIKRVTLPNNDAIAYIRVSMNWNGDEKGYAEATNPKLGPCEHMIVTVNEPIV